LAINTIVGRIKSVRGIIVIIEGYFDESGSLDSGGGVFCVAGYFISADAAKTMDEKWGAVLAEYKLPYFHMVDCAHGNDVFSGMPVELRIEIVKKLIDLVKTYTEEGFAFLASADMYDPPQVDGRDPYSYLASGCADALKMFLKMNRIDADIAFTFEEGHKNRKSAYRYLAQKVKRDRDTLTFAAKQTVRLLQAADLLAWQSCKYAKDYSFARWHNGEIKRQPRKDFLSLMEHSHVLMYINRERAIGIELWPMSKRSVDTVSMKIENDGPIAYWLEAGEDIPIVPVEAPLGWRRGGAQFAYVAFNGFNDKKFALSFDEPRLFEALSTFMAATSLFEDSYLTPTISPESLSILVQDGKRVLRIKIPGGAHIGIGLSPTIEEQLKELLGASSGGNVS
jgi:hypothetical protein